jgi:hypothetical protein
MTTTISGEEFLNSVSYDGHLSVLADHHAPIAVSATDSDQIGVSQLYLKGLHLGSCEPTLQPALRVWLDDGQGWELVGVTERAAWPWGWRETGQTERTRLVQEVWFAANDRLVVRWQVESLKPGAPAPRLAVGGAFAGAGMSVAGKTLDDGWEWAIHCSGNNLLFRKPFAFDWELRLRVGSVSHGSSELPVVEVAEGCQAFAGEVALVGGTATATLEWSFSGATAPAEAAPESFAGAEARWRGWLSALPACNPDTRYWRRKRSHAVHDLVTATVRAPGFGNFSNKLAALATPINWSSTNFFWDSMIALPTLGLINPEWAAEIVECYVDHAGPGSLPPYYMNAYPEIPPGQRYQECYAPIASWAVCKLWRCGKAEVPLARLYPSLRTLHERWFEVADHDRDGIPEWRNAGCTADNSPLYDRYAPFSSDPAKMTCHNLLPHKSVSLCSYLLMDMRCLESIAVALGKTEEARHWRERQQWLAGQILEHLWHPDEAIFHDRDTTTGEPTRVKTFFSLLPLWAGVDLPESEARRAIEQHILNPKEFWGTVPFPSVAYDEATYDPLGYWRGRTWPHVYFWNAEILSKYGYAREAEVAKERYLAVVSGSREIAENYPSQWAKISQVGMPHYAFGTGTLVHFLADWHQQPL